MKQATYDCLHQLGTYMFIIFVASASALAYLLGNRDRVLQKSIQAKLMSETLKTNNESR